MIRFPRFGRRTFLSLTAGTMLGLAVPVSYADEKPAVKPEARAEDKKEVKTPQMEVVFCLDTTGSMGGLIEGAKQKIWSIANQIASGKPSPKLKMGLVAYKDRNDAYVTKTFDLTEDLDDMRKQLMGLSAAGGGDEPESVNQALHDAVNKMKWSDDAKTLKIIFLVGDAPPHMDYKYDVKYPETCQAACKKGIIINTILCGNNPRAATAWQDICRKAEGSYVQIAQDGGVVAVATPFDGDLAKLNAEKAKTVLGYGNRQMQARAAEALKDADDLRRKAPATAADRAGFMAKGAGKGEGSVGAYDLLDSIRDGKVKLENLKKEELPKELQELTPEKRKEYLDKIQKQRTELNQQILDLDKKRSEFIQKKLAADKKTNGFDTQVLEILRKQAKKHKIEY